MTAETGNDAESSKKRGRIPQSAWPSIVERYRTGATLSAIAREYECTPSAISYIIRKAEAAGVEYEAEAEASAEDANPAEASAPALAVPPPPPPPAAPAPAPVQQTLRLNPPPRDPEPEPAPPPRMAPPTSVAPAAPAASSVSAPAGAGVVSAPAGARPEPTPPLDAVEARLRETARGCLSAYRSWRQTPGEASIQSLSDAVHELRKALARVEIDMSASRRDEQAIRPIPIPAHRAARRPQ